jgi:hypothetical protein
MPWRTADETIVAGDGSVSIAAVGTALPTTAVANLNAAFSELGYTTEDGVGVNKTLDIQNFRVWQTKQPIRRERGDEDLILSFELVQWNEVTVPLAFGGGTIGTDGGSGYKYTPPADSDALPTYSAVIDVKDGSDVVRFVLNTASIADGVDTRFNRAAMGGLPISLQALKPESGGDPYNIYFNETRFATGS